MEKECKFLSCIKLNNFKLLQKNKKTNANGYGSYKLDRIYITGKN